MSVIYVCLLFIVLADHKASLQPACDVSKQSNLKDGNIGESKTFPWLGVLRVHIHEGKSFKVALTGIVLVKKNYCLCNADDVARIPNAWFKREGKAMFIIENGKTWTCGVQSYMIHPEYEYATYNTIALVELADNNKDQLIPVCCPVFGYNTSNIYVIGYTDENQFLQKIFYKLQHVNDSLCNEFYDRIGFKSNLYTPTNYFCAFAKNNKKNCVWDNGMAVASNSTGSWILVGFGIKGPGCAAPSRFISISPYLSWIQSSTNKMWSI